MRSDELANAAGISLRQLDYWTRTGLLQPYGRDLERERLLPGSGHARTFTTWEVEVAMRIGALVEAGLNLRMSALAARDMVYGGHDDLLLTPRVQLLLHWPPASPEDLAPPPITTTEGTEHAEH